MEKHVPDALKERLLMMLGSSGLESLLSAKPRKAARANTLKTTVKEAIETLEAAGLQPEKIPWVETGLWINNPQGLDDTIEYFLGHYYIQDAASMIPALALQPKEGENVLDLTAAPGSKTTQIAALMNNKGTLIANENSGSRLGPLKFNLNKYGVLNAIVTTMDATRRWDCKIRFDKILLDAPCSCEGQVDSPEALKQWSLAKVRRCSAAQKQMIENAINMLAEDGVLVYSTCTLAPEENEEVIDYVLAKHDELKVEPVEVNILRPEGRSMTSRVDVISENSSATSMPQYVDSGIKKLKTHQGLGEWMSKKYSSEVKKLARILPQDNGTEGFTVARIRKCG
ncbi:MAG: RsmB/NOP family class I SAM-dependent RNA methyltransferase [Candidatus Altiarchaeota archaeon]|nr:RsmB/NOP family class I SAM-dependent RNA methyltransferase [Candidatus Altiarchaeota archaeon]